MEFYATVAQVIPVLLLAVVLESGLTRLARRGRALAGMTYLAILSGFVGEMTALLVLRRGEPPGTLAELLCLIPAAYLLGFLAAALVLRLHSHELD